MATPNFTVSDYAQALQALMPRGKVWPSDPDGMQAKVLASFAPSFQRSGQAGLNLLVNAFPSTALDLLDEWEASLGLPDPCAGASPTLQGRRRQIVARLTNTGGQSIPFLVDYAAALGYSITITQFTPFRMGQQCMGDQLGSQDWAFTWAVHASLDTLTSYRMGISTMGEPLEQWGNDVLECEMKTVMPAHTRILFEYFTPYTLFLDGSFVLDGSQTLDGTR